MQNMSKKIALRTPRRAKNLQSVVSIIHQPARSRPVRSIIIIQIIYRIIDGGVHGVRFHIQLCFKLNFNSQHYSTGSKN